MRQSGKLGKLEPKPHRNTLSFAKYLTPILPIPPFRINREYEILGPDWGMFGNDTIGDCTCAAVAHLVMQFTKAAGSLVTPKLADVIGMYSAVSGYDPVTGENDNGAAMTDVLARWQSVGLSGHKILGWAAIDPQNVTHRRLGVWLFGGVFTGAQLPAIAQSQFTAQVPWEAVVDDGGIEGGHAFPETGYESDWISGGGPYSNYATWGYGWQKASNAWDQKYLDEAYVVITEDFINRLTDRTPAGFSLLNLKADLGIVSQ